jgi:type VI secretion system protein ImpK
MTPDFAKAVDPVFLYVLDLLERINSDQSLPVQQERLRIREMVHSAEAQLGHGENWELAKYALCTWIDEVLIEAPWGENAHWWKENTLEWDFFKTSSAHEDFYRKAREAASLQRKDSLEVFYVCAVLGFRGLYRNPNEAAFFISQLDLPPTLEEWAKQTSMAIQLGRDRPSITDASVPIEGAPPLDGPFVLIWSGLLALILVVLNVTLGLLLFGTR